MGALDFYWHNLKDALYFSCQLPKTRRLKAMTTKLDEAKQKLQFVSRSLAHGYVNFDSLDELGVAIVDSTRVITEHQEQQHCI